jgi:hypothetical protein
MATRDDDETQAPGRGRWSVECSECGTVIDELGLADMIVRLSQHLQVHSLLEEILQPASELLEEDR